MKQLPLIKREKPSVLSKQREADTENMKAARIILANPKSEGLQREWAERIAAKLK